MTRIPDRDVAHDATGPQPDALRKTRVSLVIPVFNSELSLRRLHRAMEAAMSPEFDFEIVYVDDKSTDGSLGILREIQEHAANVVVVELPRNGGQSKAVLSGILAAHGQIIVTLDDDMQHRPCDIPRLLGALKGTGPGTLVMGIADAVKRPLFRAAAGLGANVISNLFLAKPLPLRLTTFCAFRRPLCAGLDAGSDRDIALITALVQASDTTLTVPVHLDSSLLTRSRYGLAALFRLFMGRSNYYRLPRVLGWLAGVSLLMIASDAMLLSRGMSGYPVLYVLLLGATAAWLMLALLAIKVERNTRIADILRANRSA